MEETKKQEEQELKPFHKTILDLIEKRLPKVLCDQGAEHEIYTLGGIFDTSKIPKDEIIEEIVGKLKAFAGELRDGGDTRAAHVYLMGLAERLTARLTKNDSKKEE